MKRWVVTEAERRARRRRARELNLGQYLKPGTHGPWWSAEELALLAALSDAEVAERTGRTENAVRLRRRKLGR